MKIKIWTILISTTFLLLFVYLSKEKQTEDRSVMGISLDSIFTNFYEKKVSNVPPEVFFYYTLKNKSEDTIVLHSWRCEWDKKDTLIKDIISVYKEDTFELFRDDGTPTVLKLSPYDSTHMILNPSSIRIMDYYDEHRKIYLSKSCFISDYMIRSVNYFKINNKYVKDTTLKRKIVFRDPDDIGEQIWK